MRVIVILNTGAGTLHGSGEDFAASLQELFIAQGIVTDIRVAQGEEIANATKQACEERPDIIIAGGGDGTVHAIANAMMPTKIPLGILPLGTLNHFAKDAGIPLALEDAVANIRTGKVRFVDVAEVNGRYFLNNSSIGLYPKIVRHRERQRLVWGRGKWLSLLVASAHLFRAFPLLNVRVEVEGNVRIFSTPIVFVGNNEYAMHLPELGQRTRIDGGNLSIYLARSSTRLGLIRLTLNMLLHRANQDRDFTFFTGKELSIETLHPHLDVSLDGETLHLSTPLRYRMHAKALSLIAPEAV